MWLPVFNLWMEGHCRPIKENQAHTHASAHKEWDFCLPLLPLMSARRWHSLELWGLRCCLCICVSSASKQPPQPLICGLSRILAFFCKVVHRNLPPQEANLTLTRPAACLWIRLYFLFPILIPSSFDYVLPTWQANKSPEETSCFLGFWGCCYSISSKFDLRGSVCWGEKEE